MPMVDCSSDAEIAEAPAGQKSLDSGIEQRPTVACTLLKENLASA